MAQVGGSQDKGEWAECSDPSPQAVEGFALAAFDLAAAQRQRLAWGLFRDRRPELYGAIASLDGAQRHAAAAAR